MNFPNMLKEAQRLQKELAAAQKRLESEEVEGSSGGNLVRIVLGGDMKMRSVSLDDSLMNDKEMLEDLIVAAYHDAQQKIEKKRSEEMGSLGGQLPMGLPF